MKHYTYLIVGGGMTADAAVEGIREVDSHGSIGLVSAEKHAPYNRPPLTKGLWKGKPVEAIWRDTERQKVEMHLGRRVQQLDPRNKLVTDDQGTQYKYDKLLLATGGTPRKLPFAQEHVIYYRTFDDYVRLRELTGSTKRIAVLGGGFIGSEIAAALAMNGQQVVMVFPSHGIGAHVYPHDVSQFLNNYYREKGIEVLYGHTAVGMERHGDKLSLQVQNVNDKKERELMVDVVVAGLGIVPNVELAQAAGLKVENGIVVDECLRTSAPDIYAAGDVASFYSPALNKRMRVEHEDNANTMGKQAGRNLAGRSESYNHIPMFYSDLFELGYEAVGELDARLEIQADWKEPYREGILYYKDEGRVRGVLLWNVWDKVDWARELIRESNSVVAR